CAGTRSVAETVDAGRGELGHRGRWDRIDTAAPSHVGKYRVIWRHHRHHVARWQLRTVARGSKLDGPVLYVPNGNGVLHAYQEGTWAEVGSWQLPFTGPIRGSDSDPAHG